MLSSIWCCILQRQKANEKVDDWQVEVTSQDQGNGELFLLPHFPILFSLLTMKKAPR